MRVPRLSDSNEKHRQEVVDELRKTPDQKIDALDRVAEVAASLCGTPASYVSLIEDDLLQVVGEVGLDEYTFNRDDTFCAHTLGENRVVVIENAIENPKYTDHPYVQGGPEIRFYVGLPLVVDDVPVGTLCAFDGEPGTFEMQQRMEMFGAVNAVETYLRVRYAHGPDSRNETLARRLTAARASATGARFEGSISEASEQRVREVDEELRDCADMLDIDPSEAESRLGYADTDVGKDEG